jgi:hypothetical protein
MSSKPFDHSIGEQPSGLETLVHIPSTNVLPIKEVSNG